jgi:hypothetical protein
MLVMPRLSFGVWGAEDMMGVAYTMTMFTSWHDPNNPLRIFQHPMAAPFHSMIVDVAMECYGTVHEIESFRIAARKFVKERPDSMPCLCFALAVMEKLLLDVEKQWEDEGAHEVEVRPAKDA